MDWYAPAAVDIIVVSALVIDIIPLSAFPEHSTSTSESLYHLPVRKPGRVNLEVSDREFLLHP
jgi:hypothetical protein